LLEASARKRTRGATRLLAASAVATLAAVTALYAGRLGGEWIFDDHHAVVRNDQIERLWPPTWAWYDHDVPWASRPAVSFTVALDFALHGRSPGGYRAFNMAVHLANGLLLLWIVHRLLTAWPALGLCKRDAAGLAGAVALLWSLHPLQTELVEYVSQRTELMVGFFYLLTLAASLARFGASSRRAARAWSGAAIGACALGAMSKEVIVTAPLAVLLCDRAFASGGFARALRRHRGLYTGLACSWGVLIPLVVAGPRAQAVSLSSEISPLSYLRTQAGVIAEYLRLCFWPDALRLSYPPWTARSWADFPPQGILVVALFAATLWACWRRPRLGFAGAWFFLTLAPSSSFVPVVTEIAAQRRVYLALAAVIGLMVVGGFIVLRRWAAFSPQRLRAARAGGLLILAAAGIALGWRTAVRANDYRTAISVWQEDVRIDPDHPAALFNLATALLDAGRPEPAAAYLDRGVEALERLDPETRAALLYSSSLDLVAAAYQATGRAAVGLPSLQRLAGMHPDLADVQLGYARLCLATGRAEEALAPLQRAAALDPGSAEPWIRMAEAFERSGGTQQALSALDAAIERAGGVERERLAAERARLAARSAAAGL
jgi:tetratricopeptide (TPR) repeat protein